MRAMRSKRRIYPRPCRSKPPQIGEDLSCTAASAQNLTGKALELSSTRLFLCSQHVVLRRRPEAAIECARQCRTAASQKRTSELIIGIQSREPPLRRIFAQDGFGVPECLSGRTSSKAWRIGHRHLRKLPTVAPPMVSCCLKVSTSCRSRQKWASLEKRR